MTNHPAMRQTSWRHRVAFVMLLSIVSGWSQVGCRTLPPLLTKPSRPTVQRIESTPTERSDGSPTPAAQPLSASSVEAALPGQDERSELSGQAFDHGALVGEPAESSAINSAYPASGLRFPDPVVPASWSASTTLDANQPGRASQSELGPTTAPPSVMSSQHAISTAAQLQPTPQRSTQTSVLPSRPLVGDSGPSGTSPSGSLPSGTLPSGTSTSGLLPSGVSPQVSSAEQIVPIVQSSPTVTYSLSDRDTLPVQTTALSKLPGTARPRFDHRLPHRATASRQFGCRGCAHGGCGHTTPAPNWFGLEPCAHGHWPADEYLCNGGDHDLQVNVKPDWTVNGLHEGDAVVHYDTVDGKVEIVPTCEVCIYAPRFAAVRQILGVELHEQHELTAGVEQPMRAGQQEELAQVTTVLQQVEPGRNLKVDTLNAFRERTLGVGLEATKMPAVTEKSFLPYEDFLIIRRGVFDNSEKARLNPWLQAAVAWSHDAALQVMIDGKRAVESSNAVPLQSIYTYDSGGKPCLRVCKVASKANARPGETVDFTIRFDNLGETEIGNVTVIDNLNTRLAYIPDSQECSLDATFSAQDNEHYSQVLRWEIKAPLPVGHGGVIRFQCRVQ